jgi:hypothetical protein
MSALPLKVDVRSALAHVCYGPIADIQEVGVTKENPGTLPGAWLSEYRFSEHSIRTLSNACRVGRYSSAECRNSRDHYY